MKTKIYVLAEPYGKIRYVGKTVKDLSVRLFQHVNESRHGEKNHRCNWIRTVLCNGNLPSIQLIGEVEGNGNKEEIAWIKYFKDEGVLLTNDTPGGDGFLQGHKVSEDVREKLRKAITGKRHTEETKSKMRGRIPWSKGKKFSKKHCQNLRDAAKKRFQNPEEYKKLCLINKGRKLTKNHRKKITEGLLRCWRSCRRIT